MPEKQNPYKSPARPSVHGRRITQQTTAGVIATIWGVLGWIEYLVGPQGDRKLAEIATAPQWVIFFVVCSAATLTGPVLATRAGRPWLYLFFLAPTSYVIFQIVLLWSG